MKKLMIVFLSSLPLLAHETPTERQAASDVLRKMRALEQSLNIPQLVKSLTGPDADRDHVVTRAKSLMESEEVALGDELTKDPEIGFQEERSIRKLMQNLQKHGFVTEAGIAGLKTAFIGKYQRKSAPAGNAGPHLGVSLEYAALRGTKGAFHGDQHSTQGPIGMAAAIAVAEYLSRTHTPGSVTVFGSPGEEMMPPEAKTVMYNAHVFDGMDVIVRSHSSSATTRPAAGFG